MRLDLILRVANGRVAQPVTLVQKVCATRHIYLFHHDGLGTILLPMVCLSLLDRGRCPSRKQ